MACDETVASLTDALSVVKNCVTVDHRVVIGGGATEMELYKRMLESAQNSAVSSAEMCV